MTVAVLHFALHPVTGPWSVIRALANKQREMGLYSEVAIGVLHYKDWPKEYVSDLRSFDGLVFSKPIVKSFGTASFLSQMFLDHPIDKWIEELQSASGADTVVVHMHNAWLSGAFLPFSHKNAQVLPIATFHGVAGALDLARQPVRRYLHRVMAQRLVQFGAILTSVDAANLLSAEKLFSLHPDDFHIVPNGVPIGPRTEKNQRDIDAPLILAHVGTINHGKGWEILVQAALAANAAGKAVKVVLAGTGPDEARAKAYSENFPSLIQYHGYVVNPVKTLLPNVDVFVLMSENDGLPMSIIEAMSCGAAIISTRVGGIPEMLDGGEAGLLVERDVGALTKAISELCDNPLKLSLMQNRAIERFRDQYEIERVVHAYDAIYRDQPA